MFLPSCFRVSEVILNVWGEFISHCPGLADRITLDSSRHSLDELDDSARGSLVVRYFRVPLFQIRDISPFPSCLTMMCLLLKLKATLLSIWELPSQSFSLLMKRIVKEVSLLQLHRNENKMKRVFGFGILLFSLLDPANTDAGRGWG